MRGSFWRKDSLITHILFELQPIMVFSPVTNFGHHPLCTCNSPKLQCKVRSVFGSKVSHLEKVRIRFVPKGGWLKVRRYRRIFTSKMQINLPT